MFNPFRSLFAETNVKNLSSKEFHDTLKNDKEGILIDVRTAEEVAMGYIPGAKNIDIYSSKFASELEKLDKSKSYFVYCRSGSRSSQACKIMSKAGFTTLYNLLGGISSWRFEITKSKFK